MLTKNVKNFLNRKIVLNRDEQKKIWKTKKEKINSTGCPIR